MKKENCYLVSLSCSFVFSTIIIFKSLPSIKQISEELDKRLKNSSIEQKLIIKDDKIFLGNSEVTIQSVEQELIFN